MASNERENARREKQQKKEAKLKRNIWIAIIIVVAVLIVMKICEINFTSVKNHFTNGSFSVSSTASDSAYPYSLDSSNVVVNSINDKLNLLTPSTVTVLNPSNANADYSFTHGFATPIISYCGNYFCIIDQGSNRFRLDTNSDNVYEQTTQKPILCADVSRNGKVAYATTGDNSKSVINVVSKSLVSSMSVEFNDGYIVDIAIDSAGKKLAVVAVNSVDAKLVSTIYTYSVGDDEPVKSFELVGTNVMDIHYSNSGDLYFVGTDCVCIVKGQKKLKKVFDIGEVNTVCFSYTDDNDLVYVYSKYADGNENILCYINSSTKPKMSISLSQRVKSVTTKGGTVTALFGDKIINYSLTSGKEKARFSCDDSVTSANRMSSKIFITRYQLVDVVE